MIIKFYKAILNNIFIAKMVNLRLDVIESTI